MVEREKEGVALYTLSPAMLERPRAMSRLRLPVGLSDSILQRGPGSTERAGSTQHARIGLGASNTGVSAGPAPHFGVRSPKQFPGAIPGHSPPVWRKLGQGPATEGTSMGSGGEAPQTLPPPPPAQQQQQPQRQSSLKSTSQPQPQPHAHPQQTGGAAASALLGDAPDSPIANGRRPKSSHVGAGAGGGSASGASASGGSGGSPVSSHSHTAPDPPGPVSIINHVLEAQAHAAQMGWSQIPRTQTPRGAFRNIRQHSASGVPRTSSPAVLQYLSAVSLGAVPAAALLPHQLGTHRSVPLAAAAAAGGGSTASAASPPALSAMASVQIGARRQVLLQRQHSYQQYPAKHQHNQQQQQRSQSSPSTAHGEAGSEAASDSEHGSAGAVPLPALPTSRGGGGGTPRRPSGAAGGNDEAVAAAVTGVVIVGPSTPLHVARLQSSTWSTDPCAAVSPGMAAAAAVAAAAAGGSTGTGVYVFRNAGRSALLAAAESGLIGACSLPSSIPAEAPLRPGGGGRRASHGVSEEEAAPPEGDIGSLAWRVVVRYRRRRILSGVFGGWQSLFRHLAAARLAAGAMQRKAQLELLMAAFTGWLNRVWHRRQRRHSLARALRRRLRAFFCAWREVSAAQADAYRLWLLEQVAAACPQALGEEGRRLMGQLQQRQAENAARMAAAGSEREEEGGEGEKKAKDLRPEPSLQAATDVREEAVMGARAAEAESQAEEGVEAWGQVARAVVPTLEMDLRPAVEMEVETQEEAEQAEEEVQDQGQVPEEEEEGPWPHGALVRALAGSTDGVGEGVQGRVSEPVPRADGRPVGMEVGALALESLSAGCEAEVREEVEVGAVRRAAKGEETAEMEAPAVAVVAGGLAERAARSDITGPDGGGRADGFSPEGKVAAAAGSVQPEWDGGEGLDEVDGVGGSTDRREASSLSSAKVAAGAAGEEGISYAGPFVEAAQAEAEGVRTEGRAGGSPEAAVDAGLVGEKEEEVEREEVAVGERFGAGGEGTQALGFGVGEAGEGTGVGMAGEGASGGETGLGSALAGDASFEGFGRAAVEELGALEVEAAEGARRSSGVGEGESWAAGEASVGFWHDGCGVDTAGEPPSASLSVSVSFDRGGAGPCEDEG